MPSGSNRSHEHAPGSVNTSPGHQSSSSCGSSESQKRRRQAADTRLPGISLQGISSTSSLSLPAPIRPRSTVPMTHPQASSSQGSNSTTRYRPILPAPAAPPRTQQEPAFVHGPTNLPPEPYRGDHPYVQKAPTLNIHRTAAERLPRLEARINRLEDAMEKYIDHRGGQALARSTLPGVSSSTNPIAGGSTGSGNSHNKKSSSASSSSSSK